MNREDISQKTLKNLVCYRIENRLDILTNRGVKYDELDIYLDSELQLLANFYGISSSRYYMIKELIPNMTYEELVELDKTLQYHMVNTNLSKG